MLAVVASEQQNAARPAEFGGVARLGAARPGRQSETLAAAETMARVSLNRKRGSERLVL